MVLALIRHRHLPRLPGHVWIALALVDCGGSAASSDDAVVDASAGVAIMDSGHTSEAPGTVQHPPTDGSAILDATADGPTCAPHPVASASLAWKPPKVPTLGVCTDQQIADKWAKCEDSATYNRAQCDAFDRAAGNTACLNCLFSTADESMYGPIYYFSGGMWDYNYPGCMVLQDGDASATGCAAKLQSARHCANNACDDVCPVFADYSACWKQAFTGVCKSYDDMTACSRKPTYFVCFSYPSEREKFLAYGAMFCGSGIDAGARSEAGSSISDASTDGQD